MVYRRIFFSIMILFTSDVSSFVIGVPESTQQSLYQVQLEQSFNSLYSGIAEEVSFAYLPFNRMMRMVQEKKLDAIAYQLNSQAVDTLGMIGISEPLTQFRLYAGCLAEKRCTLTKDLKFVVVADALYTNQICERLSLQCLFLSTSALAQKALKEGIVDAYIMQRSPHIAEPCLQGEGIKVYAIANTEINIYHFITRSHSAIAQPLAERLKKLKREFQETHAQECNDMLN
jgi:hypothetical protein